MFQVDEQILHTAKLYQITIQKSNFESAKSHIILNCLHKCKLSAKILHMCYRIYLKKNEEKRIIAGHSWVYANEVARIE
ncbi:MAG: hypothetical protein K2I17_06525, partial [Clostridia bacterium]|nr:hypothetical protein [Clostridia bacterium]